MEKFVNWMEKVITPKMDKIIRLPMIKTIQESMMDIMPGIFVSSIITIIAIFAEWIPWLSNLTPISDYTLGISGLILAYLIPSNYMLKVKLKKYSKLSGIAGISVHLIFIGTIIDENGIMTLAFERFGFGGLICGLIGSVFVIYTVKMFSKFSFFGKNSSIPDFVKMWVDSIIPLFIAVGAAWVLVGILQFDIFEMINNLFNPVVVIGQSLPGFILMYVILNGLYAFGISPWAIASVFYAILFSGSAENIALVASGGSSVNVNTTATLFAFLTAGGQALTLPLNLLFLRAKSKQLKSIGKATIIPSLFNINEPLWYGTPIAMNPILMIPVLLGSIVIHTVVYVCLTSGLVPIPAVEWMLWNIPAPVSAFFVTNSLSGVVLSFATILISGLIYYPFYKVFDKQLLDKETTEANVMTSNDVKKEGNVNE